MRRISRRLAVAAMAGFSAALGVVLGAGPAMAAWPEKPVKMVVAFAPGASIDAFARALAIQLQARLGQPFLVENRPGAGGTMATGQVAASPPDGYTLTVHSSTIASMGPVLKSDFDASVNLTPIAMISRAPYVVMVASNFPVKTIKELVDYAKANPDKVLYGSAGVGSTNHLQTELFNKRAGISMKHIPYKGLAGALQDLAGGQINVIFGALASAQGLVDAGKIRVIAQATDATSVGDGTVLPSIRSAGIDYETSVWWGFFGPPGLPADITNKLNAATNEALKDPAFVKITTSLGATPAPMTPEQFREAVHKEVAQTKEVVEAAKIVFQ
jgi:tripartite-type tricarboxylate transporter receptor subunit TctC